ncbi:hypothetical protein PUH89_07735 [Rhodobacter capsulatus]|uniref:Sulfotransferase family protein n=1 Tax=Rhodobacter capsulatus TaxID=1061 RepID=A0A1G7D364_RHOCA|nr:hypothetical protein [Rhodobacter capsulatus]WER10855.1 hypothetical protein PUH89_07735 [Rhodobacter capsulatus]SDE45165.1 hypothetical protein SAMN04244550_00446 [Rhodobacter capsulatus]
MTPKDTASTQAPGRPAPAWFIVTSHGWSASHWLAHNLNRHPQIACLHSSAALPADQTEPYDVSDLLARQDFARIFAMIAQFRAGYGARGTTRPADLYRPLEAQSDARLIGSVHTFRLRDLPEIGPALVPDLAPPDRRLRIVNLIRHPVNLVNSGAGQFELTFRLDLNELQWITRRIVETGLDSFERIAARHRIYPGDPEVLAFFGACATLKGLAADFAARDRLLDRGLTSYAGSIRQEDVTRDPAVFRDLLVRLGEGAIDCPEAYLDQVFADPGRNVHNARPRPTDPAALFADWAPWQQEAFAFCLDAFGLRPLYQAEGYALDMVPPGKDFA